MNIVCYALLGLLLVLQYPLWFGSASVSAVWNLRQQVVEQKTENTRLKERNDVLIAEVIDLQHGVDSIEERARAELGMIKKGETFFHVIEE